MKNDFLQTSHLAGILRCKTEGYDRLGHFSDFSYSQLNEKTQLFVPSKGETRARNAAFGSSLLLANSPMSPKIVNGSFAAIFEAGDGVIAGCARLLSQQLRLETGANASDSPGVRRRLRGLLLAGRQFSLDACLDLVHGAGGVSSGARPRSSPDPGSGLGALPPPEEEGTVDESVDCDSVATSPDNSQPALDISEEEYDTTPAAAQEHITRAVKFANGNLEASEIPAHPEEGQKSKDGRESAIPSSKICHKCGHALVQ